MRYMSRWVWLALVAVSAGCVHREGVKSVRALEAEAAERQAEMTRTPEGYLVERDGLYLGRMTVPIQYTQELPVVFRETASWRSDVPVTLQDVAEYLISEHGLQVRIAADALEAAKVVPNGAAERTQRDLEPGQFFVSYSGPVEGLLNETTARTGTWWRYRNGTVTVAYLDSRAFELRALPVETTLTRTITTESEGATSQGAGGQAAEVGGSGGTGGQTTETASQLRVYQLLDASVKPLLSPKGAFSLNPGMSMLTVTDTPDVLDRIGSLVEAWNAKMSRQVAIDVRVISLELRDSDSYGINWNVIREALNGRTLTTVSTASAAPIGVNSIGVEVIDPAYNYAGTNVVLQALSEQGNLSVVYSDSAVTMTGRPVTVRVGEQIGYIAENSQTVVPNVGVVRESKAAVVNTGVAMTILPVVTDDNQVLMQVDFSLNSLRELRKLGDPANGGVEQPTLTPRELSSSVRVKSGATIALRGLEQDSTRVDARGIGSPVFSLLGGGSNAEKRRTVLLVLLTPRVQES